MNFLPKTKLGKWSVVFACAMPVLIFSGSIIFRTFYQNTPVGNSILEDLRLRPILALTMLIGIVSGIMAFITAAVAIKKHGERSLLAFLAAIIGGMLILFLIGEFLFPH